jgi:hypothetical protein
MREIKVLKSAVTRNNWRIVLVSGEYRTGGIYFEVQRGNPQGSCITLHSTEDYEEARTLANREWLAAR